MSRPLNQREAQDAADRIRIVHAELEQPELREVLALTPEQAGRFEEWSRTKLHELATQFDVDTSESQKRMSWGMRIASTLGGLAICAAVVLFFMRYWGYLDPPIQIVLVMLTPIVALAGAEFAARRERTLYFAGLFSLVALAAFIMNLAVLGNIFNIVSTENALLAWGAFATLLAYRYGLRLLLAIGLVLLISYVSATLTAHLGYNWLDFGSRPEHVAILALLVFAVPFVLRHQRHTQFPPVYRLIGALIFFLTILGLSSWGAWSYLPMGRETIQRIYEFVGLFLSACAIWLGIVRQWPAIVNIGAVFFTIFLFVRLYHWWWDWMPKFLFFALIGLIGIGLVAGFRRLRGVV
jgi:hypothetical protein